MQQTCDLEDFIIANGGIDVRKIIARKEAIAKRCKEKWGKFKIDHFGEYTPEQIRNLLIERATPEELKFKKALDKRGIEYVFQKIILKPQGGFYIVDFYFPFKNLIVEIDGPYHETTRQKFEDDMRIDYLRRVLHYKVKRIKNEDVNYYLS